MVYQTVIIICVTLFILIIYWVNRKNFKKIKREKDLILLSNLILKAI